MQIMVATGFILILFSIAAYFLSKPEDTSDAEAWELYINNSSSVGKMLASAGRPVASTKIVKDLNGTKTYNFIKHKIQLGDTFQSSVEVFVSIQMAALFFGMGFLLFALIGNPPTFVKLFTILFGIVIGFWPISEMYTESQKRSAMIAAELPEFTELLLMVAPSMSIPAALAFTSERSKGVVSMEISELVKTLTTRSMPENEAFQLTARRLATIDARQFMAILENGYIQGSRVVEQLTSLGEQMRRADFQRRRAYAKKLPVKLVIIFAAHFIPFLIGLAFLPVVYGFTQIGNG